MLLLPVCCWCQVMRTPGQHDLILYAGGGMSTYQGKTVAPYGNGFRINKEHPSATVRLMWHPDHLLRVGLESGWVQFYSYTLNDSGVPSHIRVRGTPVLLVFSMPITRGWHVYGGSGTYVVRSLLEYNGSVRASTNSLGWMLAAAYDIPFAKNKGINIEAKWLKASTTKDGVISLQAHIRWNAWRWNDRRKAGQ